MNGPILSTILCMACAITVLLQDSLHAIFPLFESRRPHISQLYHLFGPLLGIPTMDKFHGYGTTLLLLTLLGGLWQAQDVWSIITMVILATLQPYYILVAVYRTVCHLEGAKYPLIYSSIFGMMGLMWRLLQPTASHLEVYDIPMITLWHLGMSLLLVLGIRRMIHTKHQFTASQELETIKADSFQRGECSWPQAHDMPIFQDDFEPYPILIETADMEQDARHYPPIKTMLAGMFLGIAVFVLGTSYSTIYRESISNWGIQVCVYGVTVPLILLETGGCWYWVLRPTAKVPPRKMFDDIEGARSFESETGPSNLAARSFESVRGPSNLM